MTLFLWRHSLQLFVPVNDDVQLQERTPGIGCWTNHHKPLSVPGHIVVGAIGIERIDIVAALEEDGRRAEGDARSRGNRIRVTTSSRSDRSSIVICGDTLMMHIVVAGSR
jgi:hypothetical protein